MRVNNESVWNAANAASTLTSAAFSVNQVFGWSAQFAFTSTATGTLKVQISCDYGDAGQPTIVPSTWTDMDNSSLSVTGAGTVAYNVNDCFYNWIRFVYTAASGTGTVTGRVNTKGN